VTAEIAMWLRGATWLLLTGGAVGGAHALLMAKLRPLHLVWDLDNTLLLSITPLDKGVAATETLPAERWFDQIDDDFPYTGSEPNTRTTFRPGARAALR
jgi:hypothetical protein